MGLANISLLPLIVRQKPILKDIASIQKSLNLGMGCAGEIRVTETEDYATWTLDILVKFRSSEKLQQLTAQRQSGGERSLATILYLMSLTEYARAPFSLVDEINQVGSNVPPKLLDFLDVSFVHRVWTNAPNVQSTINLSRRPVAVTLDSEWQLNYFYHSN